MPRKIAMVGTAQSRYGAPVDDLSWEIWGVSGRGDLKRADRWYEIHPLDVTFDTPGEADAWREEVKRFTADVPELVMMFPEHGLHPNMRVYPEERIRARFDTFHMMSTFSWMMAEAIDEMCPLDASGRSTLAEPGSKIGIWGVDMEYGTEYGEQRPGFRAMMSIAKALGIEVHRVLDGGLIYEPCPYPHWQLDPVLNKIAKRNNHAKHTINARRMALETCNDTITSIKGAMSEISLMLDPPKRAEPDGEGGERIVTIPYDAAARYAHLDKQANDMVKMAQQLSRDLVGWEAVDEEQTWLRGYLMATPGAL